MKGFIIPIELGLVLFALFLLFITPTVLNLRVTEKVYEEYNITNAQLTLLTLLSSTNNKKTVIQIIGEDIQSNSKPDTDVLNKKLETIIENRCYKLTYNSKQLTPIFCKPSGTSITAKIVLPYKPERLVEKIELVID